MKKTLQNTLKVGAVIALMLSAGAVSAQRTTSTGVTEDFTKEASSALGASGGSVRVVDNKGTIKYLQSANGITTLTNVTPAGGITTTWQLGGELSNNTYIEASTGAIFAIDGISLVIPASEIASTNSVSGSKNGDATVGSGYTFLVRDEATGETKKLMASDLIVAGAFSGAVTTDAQADFTVAGITPLVGSINNNKVSVYRNGAKLRVGTDYKIATDNTVNLLFSTSIAPNDWTTYTGDIIEVQWVN
jgi:hypothetical protein